MIYEPNGDIRVFGHANVQKRLMQLSPRNIFIYGPHSVGKRTLLEKYMQKHGFTDVIRFGDVTSDNIEEIRMESQRTLSSQRVITLSLTSMSRNTTERLLKIVEDSPSSVSYLMTAGFYPGITLSSRFSTFKVGYLTNADVSLVLIGSGYSANRAAELAVLGLGTVQDTMRYGKYSEHTAKALEAISYIADGDILSLDSLYSTWEDKHTKVLRDIATERLTGRYRHVSEAEVEKLTKKVAMRIMTKVDPYDRARYVPRAALAAIARENMK